MKHARTKYDRRKLKGRVIEKFGSQGAFATALGVSENTVSKKFTGRLPITISDIEEWSKLLEIGTEEYPVYYFKVLEREEQLG